MAICNMRGLDEKKAPVCIIMIILLNLVYLLKMLFLSCAGLFSIQPSGTYLSEEEYDDFIYSSGIPLSHHQYSIVV